MSCAPNDRIMQTLRVRVPGATDPMLELELFNVVDEFFRRTSAWLYHEEIDLEEDTFEYPLAIPLDTNIVRLMGVTHNGAPVSAASGTAVTSGSVGRLSPEETFPDGDASFKPLVTDLSAGVFSYAVYAPQFITVSTVPDEEGRKYPMKIIAALTLAQGCLEKDCASWATPDWMHDMFFQDWLDGTLGRLYEMPAKPWSSPPHAIYHTKRFRNAMAYRKQEALRGFNYSVPMWRYPRWA